MVQSNEAYAHYGYAAGTAGDVKGDGADDVLIGANLYDNGQSNEGQALIYHGVAATPITITGLTAINDGPTGLGQAATLTA